MIPTIVKYC